MADEYAMTHFDSAIALVVRKGVFAERIGGMGRKRLSMGGTLYCTRQDFIKDGLE